MATKNLGLVQALYSGINSPSNTKMLWYDSGNDVLKYYETSSSTWTTFPESSELLTKTNTVEYTPTTDYHPATKVYVDDSSQIVTDENGDTVAQGIDGGFLVNNNNYTISTIVPSTSNTGVLVIPNMSGIASIIVTVGAVRGTGAGQSSYTYLINFAKIASSDSYDVSIKLINKFLDSTVRIITATHTRTSYVDYIKFQRGTNVNEVYISAQIQVLRKNDSNLLSQSIYFGDSETNANTSEGDIQTYAENYLFVDLLADGTLGSDSDAGVTSSPYILGQTDVALDDTDYEIIGCWVSQVNSSTSSSYFSCTSVGSNSISIRHGVSMSVGEQASVLLKIAKI